MASPLWDRIKRRYRLADPTEPDRLEYIVRGDAVGTEDDLFVDVLARGSAPDSPDPLARELFTSLSDGMQRVVLKELRRQP